MSNILKFLYVLILYIITILSGFVSRVTLDSTSSEHIELSTEYTPAIEETTPVIEETTPIPETTTIIETTVSQQITHDFNRNDYIGTFVYKGLIKRLYDTLYIDDYDVAMGSDYATHNYGHCFVIAEHNYQGFNTLYDTQIGDICKVVFKDGKEVRFKAIHIDRNSENLSRWQEGTALYLSDGQKAENLFRMLTYTCNPGSTGKSIILIGWEPIDDFPVQHKWYELSKDNHTIYYACAVCAKLNGIKNPETCDHEPKWGEWIITEDGTDYYRWCNLCDSYQWKSDYPTD